jgi:Ca-activated chloride channel family protein
MQLANESVVSLMSKLQPDDCIGVVLFNNTSEVLVPLTAVSDLDLECISAKQLAVTAGGGTNMEAGFRQAVGLLSHETHGLCRERERRVIFLTDDMPNVGAIGGDDFLGLVGHAAEKGIYTSLLGVGLDFNADVAEAMSKAKGAWFGSIKTSAEFRKRLDDDFDYMVTPLVFNLRLHLSSNAYAIDKVFGSPEAELSTGQLMRVNTLFPSSKNEHGQTKGGVVLLHLVRKTIDAACEDDSCLRLRVSYEDRCGIPDSSELCVHPPPISSTTFFENSGVRKAVLLARYASVLRQWLTLQHDLNSSRDLLGFGDRCIFDGVHQLQKDCHQTGAALKVSPQYKSVFEKLLLHISSEIAIIDDESLQKECSILEKLIALANDDSDRRNPTNDSDSDNDV